MSRFQLLAITSPASVRDAVRALASAAPGAAPQAVSHGEVAAILAAEPTPLWRTRRRLGRTLVERQRRLEALHRAADVLAAAPGAAFDTEGAVAEFLAGAERALLSALQHFCGAEQHQIIVTLEAETALARLKGGDAWKQAQEHAWAGDRGLAGSVLRDAASALRADLAAEAMTALAAKVEDLISLPKGEEDVALNVVLQHRKGEDQVVEAALEAVDAAWDGAPRFKMIGPSPALSFAAVRVERPAARDVATAAQALGLEPSAGLEEIKAAFHEAIRTHHPDRAGAAGAEATRAATEAEALLSRLALTRNAIGAAGLEASAIPALARITREGDEAPATAAPMAA